MSGVASPAAANVAAVPAGAEKLPLRAKALFSVGALGDGMILNAATVVMMLFLTDYVAVSPVMVGTALLVGRLVDAVTDPTMGMISDRTRSRHGRRRAWLLWGALPAALTWMIVWCIPTRTADNQLLVVALVYAGLILAAIGRTIVNVPYLALSSELSMDYDERSSIQAWRGASATVGMLIGALFITFVQVFANQRLGFVVVALIFGVATAAGWLVTFVGVREDPAAATLRHSSFLGFLGGAWRNRPYVVLCCYCLTTWLAFAMGIAFLAYVITYWLGRRDLIGYVVLIMQLSTLVMLPVWNRIIRVVGKKRANVLSLTGGAIVNILAFVMIRPDMIWLTFVWAACTGVIGAAMQILPFSLAADAVDLDELRTGQRKAGQYYGTITFLFKAAFALGAGVSGFALSWAGYVANQAQAQATLVRLRLFHGVVPGLLLLASALIFGLFFSITRARAAEIKSTLELQRSLTGARAAAS